jgi:HAD superfamily hydrolase (TIGR01509 family)
MSDSQQETLLTKEASHINLADRLFLPSATQAILWDLDGTLVDSFRFDLRTCSKILTEHAGTQITIPEPLLREGFALSGVDFWRFLFDSLELSANEEAARNAFRDWACLRSVEPFPLNEGILEILDSARLAGVKMAVVSNNPEHEVVQIVKNSGIHDYFLSIIGNDGSGRAKKPAPDSYIYAANTISVSISSCVIIEDSVLGLQGGRSANAHVIGVATGADDFHTLLATGLADDCYTQFDQCFARVRE